MPFVLYFTLTHLAPATSPDPSVLVETYQLARSAISPASKTTREDDEKVAEFKKGLDACKLFLYFAVYNIADGGLYSLFTSLAGSMTTRVSFSPWLC